VQQASLQRRPVAILQSSFGFMRLSKLYKGGAFARGASGILNEVYLYVVLVHVPAAKHVNVQWIVIDVRHEKHLLK